MKVKFVSFFTSYKFINYLLATLSWLVPLFFYWLTLAPSIQLEDSGELATAALTFGVPHPSGYPLYNILVKIFSLISGQSILVVNLFSAVAGAAAAYIIYKTTKLLNGLSVLGVLAAWLFAFYPYIWSQALVAEVYTLHAFFVSLFTYLLVKFFKRQDVKYLYWLSLVTGLGICNHLMMIWLTLPLAGVFIYYKKNIKITDWINSGLLFVIGLSFYVYLPLAALSGAIMNWGDPSTWHNFWQHVLRLGYNDISLIKDFDKRWLLIAGMLRQWLEGLGWQVVIGLLFGLAAAFIRRSWIFLYTVLSVIVFQTIPIYILRGVGWNLGNDYIYSFYWSGAMIGLVIAWAVGLSEFYKYLIERGWLSNDKIIKILLTTLVLTSLPLSVWYANYKTVNLHNDVLPYIYAKELLLNLPQQSVLYIGGRGINRDSVLFALTYVQLVDGVRADVVIIDGATIYQVPKDLKVKQLSQTEAEAQSLSKVETLSLQTLLKYAALKNLTPYTLFLTSVEKDGPVLKPDGYAYRVFANLSEARSTATKPKLMLPESWSVYRMNNYAGHDYLAHMLYFQAATLEVLGRQKLGQQVLLQAIDYDNQAFSDEYQGFVQQRAAFN